MNISIKATIGKITSTHGVRGSFKIFYYTKTGQDFANHKKFYDKDGKILELNIISSKGKFIIASMDNITSCEAAETLKATEIFIDLDLTNIEDQEYFFAELQNMSVLNETGKKIGTINNVENFGAGDIIEIKFNNNKIAMFSFNEKIFPAINRIKKEITFIPPEEI